MAPPGSGPCQAPAARRLPRPGRGSRFALRQRKMPQRNMPETPHRRL